MMDALSTALNGIQSSQQRTLTAANNIANANTRGYRAQPDNLPPSPTEKELIQDGTLPPLNMDLARESVNLRVESNVTKANLAVAKTADETLKSTIDLLA